MVSKWYEDTNKNGKLKMIVLNQEKNAKKIAILKEMVIKSGVGIDSDVWYEGFREARLGRLARERDSLQRMVTVYDEAMTQFNQQQDMHSRSVAGQTQASSSPQIYSPQYSNDQLQLG